LNCNRYKSDGDEKTAAQNIVLEQYCSEHNLPMTLSSDDEKLCKALRKGITGGLSNTHHRFNIAGETHITKLILDDPTAKTLHIQDDGNVMTHVIGIDFNSLYPSSFSSVSHPANPYTNNVMYMPGKPIETIECVTQAKMEKAKQFIKTNRSELFIASVKGHIDYDFQQEFIDFPPIIRRLKTKTDETTIGPVMYQYMKEHGLPTDKKERKLTQLMDTCDEFMKFNNYYLWFLIDRCHFIIDDVEFLTTFTKHTGFNKFVTEMMFKRQQAILSGQKGLSNFYKLCMNGSYGYDIMNEKLFTHVAIKNRSETFTAQMSQRYMSTSVLNTADEGSYIVTSKTKTCECNERTEGDSNRM
jgi:hypothetical protein